MKQKRKQLREEQQPADGKLLQWHPAFYADLQIEFREEKEKLKFEREYLLSSKPMAIDVLIIKKKDAEPIHKNIGKYSVSIISSNINHHPIPFPWTISIRYMDIQIFIKQIQGR